MNAEYHGIYAALVTPYTSEGKVDYKELQKLVNYLIEKGLDGLMHGKTVFIIAHRLSTVRNADKIAVIEGGEIIEVGNHKELLAKGGRYYELYTGQHMLE